MEKLKQLIKKYREILLYLIFGVLTTIVGWAVYFTVLFVWRAAMGIPTNDTVSPTYLKGYTLAQIIQWIAAVAFAFVTNRKWVFTDADKSIPVLLQLRNFTSGRIATFFVDYLVTFGVSFALTSLIPSLTSVFLFDREWNLAEIGAKLLAALIVIVCNYVVSKVFVFKKK